LIEGAVRDMNEARSLLAQAPTEVVQPSSRSAVGFDIFEVTGNPAKDYSSEDVYKLISYAQANYERPLGLSGKSKLGVLLTLGFEPIIQRLFRTLREGIMESGESISGDDLALLEFCVYLQNSYGSRAYTLEFADVGKQIIPAEFDSLDGRRSGRVVECLLPRIPEVRQLRGVVRL
jgi:hypothetical protein